MLPSPQSASCFVKRPCIPAGSRNDSHLLCTSNLLRVYAGVCDAEPSQQQHSQLGNILAMDQDAASPADAPMEEPPAAPKAEDNAPQETALKEGAAAAGAGPDPDPIFVSKREVRKHAGKVTGKKAVYYLEFFLIDNHGYEVLAATGEDQGESTLRFEHST